MKHWITFNEPHGFSILGYDTGIQAPGRCSILSHLLCKKGKSSTEPYVVAHNILLSHASVFHTYKLHFKVPKLLSATITLPVYHTKFQIPRKGIISFSMDFVGQARGCHWNCSGFQMV